MVELQSSFFVGGAIVFFVLLAIIIFGSRGSSVPTKAPKEKKKTQKKEKAAKPKSETVPLKKRTASKKSERVAEPIKKKFVVDTTNEAHEVLEFLKGKDKAVIAQELALEEQKAAKQKGAVQKVDDTFVQPSRLISDKEAKAFLAVKPKAKKVKAEETEETEEATPSPETKGKKGSKKFYKPDASEEAARKKKKEDYEERQAAKKRREENGGIDPLETPEQRAEKKRSWREKREDETDEEHQERIKPRKQRTAEDGTEEEKKPRGPKIPTFEEVDRAVKYEAADIGDLLSSIGASYKPTSATGPKAAPSKRYSSVFSNVTRENIRKILNNLTASDLCHLASVNHFFSSLVRNDDLWHALYVKDFGKKDKSAQHRTWRAAYRAAYRSKSNEKAKNQKTEEGQ